MAPPSQVAGVKERHLPILRNAVSVLPGLGTWLCAGVAHGLGPLLR